MRECVCLHSCECASVCVCLLCLGVRVSAGFAATLKFNSCLYSIQPLGTQCRGRDQSQPWSAICAALPRPCSAASFWAESERGSMCWINVVWQSQFEADGLSLFHLFRRSLHFWKCVLLCHANRQAGINKIHEWLVIFNNNR